MNNKINWKSLKTINNYPADEVISALQKEIRRGHIDEAIFWACELCRSGDDFQKKCWERLTAIAVEDIGFGDPMACVIVATLKNSYNTNFEKIDDSLIQVLFAAGYLAKCKKDRFIDEYKNILVNKPKLLKIPDYALDKHTLKGKALNRGDKHFWTVAAKLNPELTGRNKKYLKILLQGLKDSNV